MNQTHPGPEAGRKRLAKLLGLAPFRVEIQYDGQSLHVFIDGVPANAEQMQTFKNDVFNVTTQAKFRMN